MTIDEKIIPWIISAFLALISLLGWLRTRRGDIRQEGGIRRDVEYIKQGVDDIQKDIRQMRDAVSDLSTRVTRCEESCKSAHHRLDGLEK